MSKRLILAGLIAAGILFFSSSAIEAATYSWCVSSGDWSTAAYWGGTEPTYSDNAYIQNGGTANVTQLGERCWYLYLGDAGSGKSGTVEMTGGNLSVSSDSNVGYYGTGTFTQSGGTISAYYLCLGSA